MQLVTVGSAHLQRLPTCNVSAQSAVQASSKTGRTFLCRVRNAFKMAQRAIPLVADHDPVEVIYEDDDIIAVNKPTGVISAPKHRFTVRSTSFAC